MTATDAAIIEFVTSANFLLMLGFLLLVYLAGAAIVYRMHLPEATRELESLRRTYGETDRYTEHNLNRIAADLLYRAIFWPVPIIARLVLYTMRLAEQIAQPVAHILLLLVDLPHDYTVKTITRAADKRPTSSQENDNAEEK
jgi:hypothetical protein